MAANFCRFVFKNWARYTLCQMDVFSNFSSIFRDREMWYLLMKLLLAVHKRLPLGEASVTVGKAGEREKKTRGTMGRGKRSRALSIFSTRAIMHCSCFRLLLFLLGYPAGATAEERGSINIQILCFRVNYCFLQYEPLIGSNKLSRNVFDNFLWSDW